MSSSFAITVTSSSLKLSADRSGAISVTVTNTSGRELRGRAILEADPAALPWFTLADQAERNFAANTTEVYVVNISAPPGAPTGSATVRLNMVAVDNPDEDFTRGPTITVAIPEPPQPVKKPFPWWIVAAVLAILALAGGVGGWLLWRNVTVPNLAGLTVEDARQALEQSGLAAGETREDATGAIAGTVLAQEPSAGARAARGSAVALTVEAARVLVPNLRTLTLSEARLALERAGLILAEPTYEPSGDDPGTITAQDPPPNTEVSRSSQIRVNVEPERVPVPLLIGLNVDEARAQLTASGLTSGAVTQVSTDPSRAGQVIDQNPPPDTPALLGAPVALSVEKTPLIVPDLVTLTEEEARARLAEVGLLVSVTPTVSKQTQPGLVLAQDPPADQPILDNGNVKLTISREPTQWRSGQVAMSTSSGVGLNLDTGAVASDDKTDLYLFFFGTGAEVALTLDNGARMVLYGPERPGFSGCLASQWRSNAIPTGNLPVGTYICVLTNEDRIAQAQVTSAASDGTQLSLDFITWAKDGDRLDTIVLDLPLEVIRNQGILDQSIFVPVPTFTP